MNWAQLAAAGVTKGELELWNEQLLHGLPAEAAEAAEKLASLKSRVDPEFIFTVCDKLWRHIDEVGGDLIEASGTDPHNAVPTAKMTIKGESKLVNSLTNCRNTMVGVKVETNGLKFAFYVDVHDRKYEKAAWTSISELRGIWDILNYYRIWPMWYFPIWAQPISHAVFIGPLCTIIENMMAECAIRLQSGIMEFLSNIGSLNFDIRTWFGTLLQSNGNIATMLKTPMYIVRSNPFLDTSPMYARTVRMESCATVITEITQAYGVDVSISLWEPGDPQPDPWANLDQITYVAKVVDRSQITGPTKTVLDSVIRTVVDLEGSLLGKALDPLLNPQGLYAPEGAFIAPAVGINFVEPYAILIAPESGEKTSIISCDIYDHTPKGWQMELGGKSPKWINDLINATLSWLIDSIMIVIGLTGVPSDLLAGFLNDAFLAFQLIQHYERRNDVGPYHPAIERFEGTESAPYNIEALFAFVNMLYESRGYTSATVVFRNGEEYALGRDIFRGGLMSLVYDSRTKMFTDYIELIMWKIDQQTREVLVQIGDGKADEPPLAKHQRFITALQEGFNVLTLAPKG